jgi:hypothetical protein
LRFSGAISFAIVGDTGSGQTPQRQIAEVLRTQAVDLVVHLGDVIYPYFTEGWVDSRCLSAYRRQMREVPWFFALGNHDLLAGPQDFLRTFRSPTNDVPAAVHAVAGTSPEHYYSFDHGDAHFAVLFQPYAHQYLLREGDPQYGWLTNDLARTSKPWRLILLHHPLQTSGNHRFDDIDASGIRDCTEVRNVLLPVAQRYGVQAIFAGHDHNFERFIPTNGVQTFVLGGGGIASYPLVERDVGTAQFYQLHHCARVTIDGPDLRLEALGTNGAVFDWMTLRLAPSEVELGAEWHTPSWPAGEPSNGDNNRVGQIFDFRGPARAAVAGDFSNLGEFHANHDGTNLFVGFSQSMLYGDSTIFLFLEVPRLSGVTSLAGLGDGILDPLGEGADGLDFLTNLTFEGWAPAIACLIGDEMADAPDRGHRRPAAAFSSGQGVFRLDDAFHDVSGVRLQQFDRSPQVGGGSSDTSADFSEVSIPLSELGGLQPGDVVRVGAVVGRPAFTGQPAVPGWELDRGFLGAQISGGGTGQIVLRGLAVRLGPNPDPDADGLTTNEEIVLGTDPGKPDTDTDGLLDGWEVRFAFDPLSAAGAGEAGEDADNDGMTNIDEQSAGTDPRDPGSRLVLIAIPEEPDRLVLLWGAVPGLRYQVQESSEAASGGFADVLPAPRTATGTLEAYEVNLAPPGGGNRFYRIRLVP